MEMEMTKRIIQALMEVSVAKNAIRREEREAQRDKRQAPRSILDRLQANLRLAEENLFQAECAVEAMQKYPPLKVVFRG